MSHPRQLTALRLALALALALAALTLATMPLFAQTAPAQPAPSTSPATAGATESNTTQSQAATPDKPAAKSPDAGSGKQSSPFDYRSSEEISEDVPVSFPVDI